MIGTCRSGNADFMDDENCFVVDCKLTFVSDEAAREMPLYAGHQWLEPDVEDLRLQLRSVRENSERRNAKASCGLSRIHTQFGLDAGRKNLEKALDRAAEKFEPPSTKAIDDSQIRLAIEGEYFAAHSFSNINEELTLELLGRSEVTLSVKRDVGHPTYDQDATFAHRIRGCFNRELPGGPQVVIRHRFPPNWEPPAHGAIWVHIQPWEMHYLPRDWLKPLRDRVDEIWAPSRFVRDAYVRSGVSADKIHVIPWGVDSNVFSPLATPLLLPTSKPFAFLFVGGTIERKGFDLLLDAYLQEFDASDDVCLVVKDQGTETFYRGAGSGARIREAQQDPNHPAIFYVDINMSRGQLASLYRACDCLVAPYRGEGFGLPILEAMACGRPAIVPCGGASDDFVSDDTGFMLPSRMVEAKGAGPLCGAPLWLEVGIDELRRKMRVAYENRLILESRGKAAAKHVAGRFTWKHTVDLMLERLRALVKSQSLRSASVQTDDTGAATRANKVLSPRLSLALAVQNEEATLSEKLAMLVPYVDEIIAIDLKSTDRSVAIAKEYGSRIISSDSQTAGWKLALQHCTTEWILLMGHDEFATTEAARMLRSTIAGLGREIDAASVEVREAGHDSQRCPPFRREIRLVRNRADAVARVLASDRNVHDGQDGSMGVFHTSICLEKRWPKDREAEIHLAEWWLLPWICKKGRVFIDVGANVGTWTKALAPHFTQVHAIEPGLEAVRHLQTDAPENVKVHAFAAWNCDAVVEFSQFAESVHLSAYFQDEGINTGPSQGKIQIPCRTIDGLELADAVDFIKCDTEGAEIECLRGAESTILRDKPWMLVEVHSRGNFTRLTQLLADWGYVFTVVRDPHYEPFSRLWYEHCWLSCQWAGQ